MVAINVVSPHKTDRRGFPQKICLLPRWLTFLCLTGATGTFTELFIIAIKDLHERKNNQNLILKIILEEKNSLRKIFIM